MLSICIPIYNQDINELVAALHNQAIHLEIPYEIICIDDCSEKSFIKLNEDTCSKSSKYIKLDQNIGRSKIRNLFLNYSRFDYLLFLDCDSVIISENFISKYNTFLKEEIPLVICGGRIYDKTKPPRQKRLRWKYGSLKESQPFNIRQKNPNKSFMTNNFVISRKILENLKFDERLSQYGHEDTLFGFQLKKNNISIKHIDNPVLNGELETNSEYLKKTEFAFSNLKYVLEISNFNKDLIKDITILKYYEKCRRIGLRWIIIALFIVFKPFLKFILSAGIANLFLFNFYKLGYFGVQMKLNKKII